MIPKHAQFVEAIKEKKKLSVRYYSHADGGVLDRICAPMSYGPGDRRDGLNRYWFWDYASSTGNQLLGLMPKQIEDLQTLGLLFDPADFITEVSQAPAAGGDASTKVKAGESGAPAGRKL
jgi:hypothetical protein